MRQCFLIFLYSLFYFHLYGGKKIEITGQQQLHTPKGQPLTINLTDLIVNDPDNKYPDGFELEIFHGEHFKSRGQTIFPDNNFTGTLYVPVHVKHTHEKSNRYDLLIEVI